MKNPTCLILYHLRQLGFSSENIYPTIESPNRLEVGKAQPGSRAVNSSAFTLKYALCGYFLYRFGISQFHGLCADFQLNLFF